MVTDSTMSAPPANDTIAALAERFPNCFAQPERGRWPLKVGIHEDIKAALPDIAWPDLLFALRIYCANVHYLRRSTAGTKRIDLQGSPVGVITTEEARHAKRKLDRQIAKKRERKHGSKPITLAGLKAAALARKQANNNQAEHNNNERNNEKRITGRSAA